MEQIRRAPRLVRDDVSEAVLDAMPLETGDLVAATVDGATLLGNHRRLQEDAGAAARHYSPFGVVVLELADLPRVNAEEGHVAGDLLIKQAARHARRAAARLGGTAYRVERAAAGHPHSRARERTSRPTCSTTSTRSSWPADDPRRDLDLVARRGRRDGPRRARDALRRDRV